MGKETKVFAPGSDTIRATFQEDESDGSMQVRLSAGRSNVSSEHNGNWKDNAYKEKLIH